jgi:Protein of unknown function (DUF1084)
MCTDRLQVRTACAAQCTVSTAQITNGSAALQVAQHPAQPRLAGRRIHRACRCVRHACHGGTGAAHPHLEALPPVWLDHTESVPPTESQRLLAARHCHGAAYRIRGALRKHPPSATLHDAPVGSMCSGSAKHGLLPQWARPASASHGMVQPQLRWRGRVATAPRMRAPVCCKPDCALARAEHAHGRRQAAPERRAGTALLLDVHTPCALLGRDLPAGTQPGDRAAAADVPARKHRGLRGPDCAARAVRLPHDARRRERASPPLFPPLPTARCARASAHATMARTSSPRSMLVQSRTFCFASMPSLCSCTADVRTAVQVASSCFLVLVSLGAAAGFITYGGRLFLMLHRFPIESPGRLKKLREARATPASACICLQLLASRAQLEPLFCACTPCLVAHRQCTHLESMRRDTPAMQQHMRDHTEEIECLSRRAQ